MVVAGGEEWRTAQAGCSEGRLFCTPEYAFLAQEVAGYPESRKSFDPLSSVRMYRYDLYHFGRVLPETDMRVADEDLSFMAEGMNRVARTKFVLPRQGSELAYHDNGGWASYRDMLVKGKETADDEALADPRRKFLAHNANDDLFVHYEHMLGLQPGEQYAWASPYRQDIEDKYGADFMDSCGHSSQRKMGFLYLAHCDENGDIVLESQTIDGDPNDPQKQARGVAGALQYAVLHKGADMNGLVAAHDEGFGGDVYAGRPGAEIRENVWQMMQQHRDLIEYFLNGLKVIAGRREPISNLEGAIKEHVYGTWAALKNRIDGWVQAAAYQPQDGFMPVAHFTIVEQEVRRAFESFAQAGVAMVGCGGAIEILQGRDDILNADPKTVFDSIFGKESSGPDGKGPLRFKCKNGHWNHRPFGQLIPKCRVSSCKNSVAC